jgi:hypothetical protein
MAAIMFVGAGLIGLALFGKLCDDVITDRGCGVGWRCALGHRFHHRTQRCLACNCDYLDVVTCDWCHDRWVRRIPRD